MNNKRISVWLGAFIFSTLVAVSTHAQTNSFDEVEATVNKYLDGTSKGTPNLLSEAFDENAKLQFVREGELVSWAIDDYAKGFEEGVKYDRVGRIVSMDITNTAASVKVEIAMNDNIYVDYLLLLKTKSGWKIVNKTFTVR